MENSKIQSLLGLCQKAGKLKSGEFSCENALRSGEAVLILVAEDASANTKKKFSQKSFYYDTPYIEWGTKEFLGGALGKEYRAVIAIMGDDFANKLQSFLQDE